MSTQEQARKFLVLHDYGMGGLWWWISATSAEEITSAFAEVEIIDDQEKIRWASTEDLADLTMTQAIVGPLATFYETRNQQRQDPAFGKLLGKDRVYLKLPDPDANGGIWYTEHDRTGRRIRQVQVEPDGTMVATSRNDWPLNPPYDLGDPRIAACETSGEDFTDAWRQATQPF